MRFHSSLLRLFNVIGPFLGLALVIGLFSCSATIRPYFLSGPNFKVILAQTTVVGICALGMTMIIVAGGIDLSIGSVVALTTVIGARTLAAGHSTLATVLLMIAAAAGVGMLNGVLIAGARMMPFIVTLGTMGVARGTGKWLAGNQAVNFPDSTLNNLMATGDPDHFFPIPTGVWEMLVLGIVMSVVMTQTVFGRQLFAIGSNEATARLSGIRVRWNKFCAYAVAGAFFGIAGVMQTSRLTQGDPSAAVGLELDVIAAVVIGGASLNGGAGSIPGSLVGALIMAVLRNGSSQMNWPNYMQEIIIGAVIVMAVAIDKWRQTASRGGTGSLNRISKK